MGTAIAPVNHGRVYATAESTNMNIGMRFQGMMSLECTEDLEKALRSVLRVENAQVSYPTKRRTVIASDETRKEALLEVVERTGYQAEIITGDGAAAASVGRALRTYPRPRSGIQP